MQIKKLADELGVTVMLVKKCLRDGGFSTADRTFAGAETDLDRAEERAVREAHARGDLKVDRGRTLDVQATVKVDPTLCSDDVAGLPEATVRDLQGQARGAGEYPVFLHEEVLAWLSDPKTPADQRRVFTRRLHELLAHGRATRMKGVKGANAGWLRTPLGGNSGFQFYLWLSNSGEPIHRQVDATKALHRQAPSGARFLRAVRHHEETNAPLDVGSFDDYAPLSPAVALAATEDGLVNPLMDAQQAIVADRARVRVLVGQPGAGKTTSLQSAATRLSGRALYVTWSNELASRAREWFATFAPLDLEVVVWTYREMLAHVDPRRPVDPDLPYPEAVALLRARLEPFAGQLGPWRKDGHVRAEELYAELHAHVVGAALPIAFRGRRASDESRLSDDDYRALRRDLGKGAADGALLAHNKLADVDRRRLFPGVIGAFDRAAALQQGALELDVEQFAFDWILVDEVQDLTLAEAWLLIDVSARSGRARGVNPGMIFAGDEAQTVRPTAFEFGPLSDLVLERLAARTDRRQHELVENLRSPEAVAGTIHRVREALYRSLPRTQRPRGQRGESPADVTLGRVMQVEANDASELRKVMELFALNRAEAALVYPGTIVPERILAVAREVEIHVWTSETIKGLEFRIVGVLDVPEEVARIEGLVAGAIREHLAIELARSSIDRFVVACSRSTETLALIGKGWATSRSPALATIVGQRSDASHETGSESSADSGEGQLGLVRLDVLASVLEVDATDAIFQVDALIEQSLRLSELGDHEGALALAENAAGLLGHAGRPGAAGSERRRRAYQRVAQASVLAGLHLRRFELLPRAARAFRDAGRGGVGSTVTAMANVLTRPFVETEACKRLAVVASGLGEVVHLEPMLVAPLMVALRAHGEAILDSEGVPSEPAGRAASLRALEALSTSAPSSRETFEKAHRALLVRTLRHVGAQRDKARRAEFAELRRQLHDTSLGVVLDAEHAEACGELSAAVVLWERAGRVEDALRCARSIPDFDASARLAEECRASDAPRLAWGRDLYALLSATPSGSLSEAELAALRDRARRVLAMPEERRRA